MGAALERTQAQTAQTRSTDSPALPGDPSALPAKSAFTYLTDTHPIYAAYEQLRQANPGEQSILLFVECQTTQDFRAALETMPTRHSSEWRHLDPEWRALNKSSETGQ